MAVTCSGFGVSQYLLANGYVDIQIFSHFPRPVISALASQNISLSALSSLLGAIAGVQPASSPPTLLLREDADQGGGSRKAPGSGRERFHPHGLHQLPHAPAQLPGRGLEDDFGEEPGAACLLVTLAALSSEPRNPAQDPAALRASPDVALVDQVAWSVWPCPSGPQFPCLGQMVLWAGPAGAGGLPWQP